MPCFIRWPGHFPAGTTLNGIVSQEDWLPTFAAIAGDTEVKERLRKGTEINGRTYKNYIDGHDLLDYLSGKTDKSPRNEFWYVNDEGSVMAARYGDWYIDHAFVIIPIQGMAAKFLMTMKEYPPSQTPGSWNLSAIEEALRKGVGNSPRAITPTNQPIRL